MLGVSGWGLGFREEISVSSGLPVQGSGLWSLWGSGWINPHPVMGTN